MRNYSTTLERLKRNSGKKIEHTFFGIDLKILIEYGGGIFCFQDLGGHRGLAIGNDSHQDAVAEDDHVSGKHSHSENI